MNGTVVMVCVCVCVCVCMSRHRLQKVMPKTREGNREGATILTEKPRFTVNTAICASVHTMSSLTHTHTHTHTHTRVTLE